MSMSKSIPVRSCLSLITTLLVTGCGSSGGAGDAASTVSGDHQELQIVNPAAGGSSQGAGMVSAQGVVNIGSVYLENQISPLSLGVAGLQASDLAITGKHGYIFYSTADVGGVVVKSGAVQHVTATACDDPGTLRTEYCLFANSSLLFPDADLFSGYSDGTNLWVTGSTLSEDQAPKYARVFKVNLNGAMDPASIAVTQALQSYAGTGVTMIGTKLLVTTGASNVAGMQGGLTALDPVTLAPGNAQLYYDARGVAADPTNAARAFVVRGAVSGANLGAVAEFAADVSAAPVREIATGGNSIAESKSSILVGKTLILTSLGDQGFKVSCKATGNSLASVAAPVVSGISPALTVTNSVAALPGYILAANGEAGVYVYTFQKSNLLNTNYCQGVSLVLLGRLSLGASGSYINGELSANSIKYVPIFNLLNVLTAKLVTIASGNKGVSLINMSGLTVSLGTDVDDF